MRFIPFTKKGQLVWLVAVVLAATACGGSSDSTADTATTETSAGTQAPQSSTTTESENEEEPTSLSAFFGFDEDNPEALAAQNLAWETRSQELIAACMANQGFQYIPAVQPASTRVFDQDEYIREFGFGISIQRFDTFPEDEWVDPNEEIKLSLSGSELDAYNEALNGDLNLVDEAQGIEEALENSGCVGEAFEQITGAVLQLQPLFDDLQARVDADPRVVASDQTWPQCMADRGYSYRTPDELFQTALSDFRTRFEAIVGQFDPLAELTPEELDAFWAQSNEARNDFFRQAQREHLSQVDQEKLSALQQEERDLAVSHRECFLAQEEIILEVTREYETQFIRENRDQLEQARSSLDFG